MRTVIHCFCGFARNEAGHLDKSHLEKIGVVVAKILPLGLHLEDVPLDLLFDLVRPDI